MCGSLGARIRERDLAYLYSRPWCGVGELVEDESGRAQMRRGRGRAAHRASAAGVRVGSSAEGGACELVEMRAARRRGLVGSRRRRRAACCRGSARPHLVDWHRLHGRGAQHHQSALTSPHKTRPAPRKPVLASLARSPPRVAILRPTRLPSQLALLALSLARAPVKLLHLSPTSPTLVKRTMASAPPPLPDLDPVTKVRLPPSRSLRAVLCKSHLTLSPTAQQLSPYVTRILGQVSRHHSHSVNLALVPRRRACLLTWCFVAVDRTRASSRFRAPTRTSSMYVPPSLNARTPSSPPDPFLPSHSTRSRPRSSSSTPPGPRPHPLSRPPPPRPTPRTSSRRSRATRPSPPA